MLPVITPPVYRLVIEVVLVMSQILFRPLYRALAVMLEMEIRSACRVVVNDNNYCRNIVHRKQNDAKYYYFDRHIERRVMISILIMVVFLESYLDWYIK